MEQEEARDILRRAWGVRHALRYLPGPHPASCGEEELSRVLARPREWLVSPKCDGERRGVVFTRTHMVMFDRLLCAEVIPIAWRSRPTPLPLPLAVDAEVVSGVEGRRTLVMFDLICMHSGGGGETSSMVSCATAKARVKALADVHDLVASSLVPSSPLTPRLLLKPWVYANTLPDMHAKAWWRGVSRVRPVPQDGLIFMHASGRLTNGNQTDVLKWKPRHTVDCWIFSGGSVWVNDRGVPKPWPFPSLRLLLHPEVAALPPMDVVPSCLHDIPPGRLFELEVEAEGALRVLRPRSDKPYANDVGVVERTVRHARESPTLETLLSRLEEGGAKKSRKRERGEE